VPVPKPTEVGFFAALPMAVEASVTEMHVDEIAGEEPTTHHVSIEASVVDDTVTAAPADDPFLASLFAAPESTVHPEAIPLVDGPVRGGRWVKRSRRDKASDASRAPKSRAKTSKVKTRRAARAALAASTAAEATRSRGPRPASTLLSMGAMLFSAVLLVGTTVPANAFITFAAEDPSSVTTSATTAEGQKVSVAADASISEAARDTFTVTSYSDVLKQKYGTRVHTFAPTAGTIRWPFPYATPISSGYGSRVAPCRGCSSQHNGVDFTPGMGTPIYAIADGVVTEATFSGSFGQHVYLEHVINGKKVESYYAHMIGGSSPLSVGQTVKVGDLVGLVGSTGASTGAHLHLEVHLDGVVVDPFAWLEANAT
jgi:murein DD-endopeptidase MepM/ murein hydrolase activator NlpD